MSIWQLAWRNVRHQARNYAAYFLSSSFAVWMFFLYGSMLLHPDLQSDSLPEMTREILLMIEVVVAFFSVLFILYAHSAFLKARLRELATLSLLGMLYRPIARMVRYENLTIGLAAITTGVLAGLICLKLFLLGMSRVLGLAQPIGFAISWEAILWTYAAFLLIFIVITLLGQWSIRRVSVAEAFQEAARPKEPPRFAWWKVALCAVTLAAAYAITLTSEGHNIGDRVLFVLPLLMIGTYLLLTQGSVAILRALQVRPAIYTYRTNLLAISQLIFKLRENAKILFMVATLSSISLIATGLFYSAMITAAEKAEEDYPVSLQVNGQPAGLTPERVTQVLAEHGVKVAAQAILPQFEEMTLLRTSGTGSITAAQADVVPLSALNTWLLQRGREPLALSDTGGALLGESTPLVQAWVGHEMELRLGEGSLLPTEPKAALSFRMEVVAASKDLNGYRILVLPDPLFAQLARAAKPEQVHLYQFANWRGSQPAVMQLYEEVRANWPADQAFHHPGPLVATAIAYDSFRRTGSLGFFLALFVAALFFLASGNMLYFKLFTDLYQDRRQFQMLTKVGILQREVQRVVSIQTLVLFFVPLVLSVINAGVALRLATAIFATHFWAPLLLTAGGYTLFYLVYYLITRRTYVSALLAGARGGVS